MVKFFSRLSSYYAAEQFACIWITNKSFVQEFSNKIVWLSGNVLTESRLLCGQYGCYGNKAQGMYFANRILLARRQWWGINVRGPKPSRDTSVREVCEGFTRGFCGAGHTVLWRLESGEIVTFEPRCGSLWNAFNLSKRSWFSWLFENSKQYFSNRKRCVKNWRECHLLNSLV